MVECERVLRYLYSVRNADLLQIQQFMSSAEARETEGSDKFKHACSFQRMDPSFIIDGDPLACMVETRSVGVMSRSKTSSYLIWAH